MRGMFRLSRGASIIVVRIRLASPPSHASLLHIEAKKQKKQGDATHRCHNASMCCKDAKRFTI